MKRRIYRAGDVFGRLTLVEKVGSTKSGHAQWSADCSCGTRTVVIAKDLGQGNTTSCGCLRHELLVERNTTHGLRYTPEWATWRGMVSRCHNPNDTGYHKYGAKGVTVCDRWRASFADFYEDMGPRPADKSIDRIDPTGNYEPTNCRWATASQQANNKRPRTSPIGATA